MYQDNGMCHIGLVGAFEGDIIVLHVREGWEEIAV
jgi:hypothetical protein